VDAQVGDPGVVGEVLQAPRARLEVEQHQHRVGQRHDRAEDREDRPEHPRHQRAEEAAAERPEEQDRQVDGHAEIRK
jgi:hypothetical protein